MAMRLTTGRRPDPRPAVGLALAVLLHVLGLAVLQWQGRGAARERPAVQQRPLSVRLLWPEPAPRAEAPVARERAARSAAPANRAAAVQSAPAPAAITALPAAPGATSPAEAAPAPEPAASRPLLLSLPARPASAPPRPVREEALNDPRSNTRQSYSERFAATLGTDLTERITPLNGGKRVRKGSSCYEVMDSRASQIDPYGPKWPGAVRSCN